MKLSLKGNAILGLALYVLLGIVFLLNWVDIRDQYMMNYGVLCITYIIVGGIYFFAMASGKVYFFDTFNIVSFLYLMIMVIYPIYDYTRLDLTKAGVDTSDACIEGTLIFLVSYIIFCIGYFMARIHIKSNFFEQIDRLDDSIISKIAILCWCIGIAGALAGQISRGFSLQYILSMGTIAMQEDVFINSRSGGLLFLLKLAETYTMAQIMILVYTKNFLLKVITYVISLVCVFMGGSRIGVLVICSAPVIYWFIKRRKTPSLKMTIASFLGALFLFAVLQVARVSMAQGASYLDSVGNRIFSIDTYMDVFYSDFSTYKVYYGILEAIPEKMDFLLGRGIIGYTLALAVPRALWPDKPDAPEREVVYAALGQKGMDSGFAYPNIGIFYSEFGIIGCIVLMWIFGVIMSKSRKLYMMKSKSALVVYSFLWPFCFQLVARSPSMQIYSFLFALLPFIMAYIYRNLFARGEKI